MNKKVWVAFILVFIAMLALNIIVHGVILASAYQSDEMIKLMRPESESRGLAWLYYLVYLVQSFFLALIFSKGYEGKGIMEGVRFGLYTGFLLATPMAFASYAMYPMPGSLAIQ